MPKDTTEKVTTLSKAMLERPKPVILQDEETDNAYTLEFSRDSIRFAERQGFAVQDLGRFPATNVPLLFFYAFRMHHKHMAQRQTDAILEDMGGLSPELMERLIQLYNAPMSSLIASEDEGAKKSRFQPIL